MNRRLFALLLTGLLLPVSTTVAEVTAVQMTPENVARLQHQGPDAWGGIGDWYLSNGTICAVIADVAHESDLSDKGGVLIDLGYVGRADDQYVSAQDLIGGSRKSPVEIDTILSTVGKDSASISTFGETDGIYVETRYTMNEASPNRLFISKHIRRLDDAAKNFGVYVPVTFNYHSMETFLLSSTDPSKSNGFQQEEFSRRGVSAFKTAARNVDTIIMLGPEDSLVPISYGWRLAGVSKLSEGETVDLPRFVLADWGAAAFLTVTDDFSIGSREKLGLLQLLQVARMKLAVGEELRIDEEVVVGAKGDVAAITDQLFATAPVVSGRTVGEGVVLHVIRKDGAPFTHVRPGPDGAYSFRAPAGSYTLRAVAPGGLSAEQVLEVADSAVDAGTIDVGTPARVTLPRGEAMRLVFKGINGTPDPDFEDSLTGFSVKDDKGVYTHKIIPAVYLAGIESDISSVAILPGTYRVYATRGIEYSLETAEITVGAGETVNLAITPPSRAVETPGYIAADLHVHSGPSMDNSFSTSERVRTFVAEHGEVMVAAEHETLFDFTPLIARMGVGDKIVAVMGTEMTSEAPTARAPHTIGHANFFPLTMKPHDFRKGVPNNEGRRMREVLDEVRLKYPEAVSQLNHARDSLRLSGQAGGEYDPLINNQAYFDHMGTASHPYDPAQALTTSPNNTLIEPDPVTGTRDIDFDAMEIMNGEHEHAPDRVEALRRDWNSLLLQGVHITGTANSDSHFKEQQVALPRNMIAVADDRVAAFDVKQFSDSIRKGNMYGTTGPLLQVTLSGAKMGDLYAGKTGTLDISVLRPDWIAADHLNIYVNGKLVQDGPIPEGGQFSTELQFDRDSYVLIDVTGTPGEAYKAVYPGFLPYAFSNPIFVDADGDGTWTAPGL